MTRIGVVGATGRTGKFAVEAVLRRRDCSLAAAVVSPRSPRVSAMVPDASVPYSDRLEDLGACDVVIDFSTPEVSAAAAKLCAERKIAIVIATTGHSPTQIEALRAYAARIPLAVTPNTSLGAAALSVLAREAKQMLGAEFDIEVMEIHHRMKKDAPSGTARSVLEDIRQGSQVVFGRDGQRQSDEIGVVSLRGGDVAGDHTVYFLGHGERIEIAHRVSTREVFGSGAVRFATSLVGKPPGLYGAKDLL